MFMELGNLSGNKEAQHKALYDIAGLILWEAIEEDESPYLTRDIKKFNSCIWFSGYRLHV